MIDAPPPHHGNPYQRAAANDGTTVNSWRETWLSHAKANKEKFGSFGDKTIGALYGINRGKPAIICGSGPSLKTSIPALRENADLKNPLMVVSCLHNFGYFEDEGFHADYYMTLDAGKIVIDDVYENRKEKPEHYWAASKGKKLLATTMTDPKLFDLWQGEIYLFNILMPDLKLQQELKEIEQFSHYVSCGGNALGGCFYVTKAIFGSDVIHFVGADFCFDYNNQFHSYKTHYDTVGQYITWPDVYGVRRKTWASYLGFKFWFDWVVMNVPGNYVNCSEGLFGAYPEGNLKHMKYMSLSEALRPYRQTEWVQRQKIDATSGAVLETEKLELKDLFSNPKFDIDLVMF